MRKLTEEQKRQKNIIDYHRGKVGRDAFIHEAEGVKSTWDYIPRTDDRRTVAEKQQEVFDWYED